MTPRSSITFKVKRIYEAPAPSDGCRVLVDRIWPRGLSKDAATLDAWLRDIAPSAALRQWFGHEPARWVAFKRKYLGELNGMHDVLERLLETCTHGTVTLLFAAEDDQRNNAVALKKYLNLQFGSKGRRSHRCTGRRTHLPGKDGRDD